MKATTTREQIPTAEALARLLTAHAHLPAADLRVGQWLSNDGPGTKLQVSLHQGLSDFEPWRVALGLDPRAVEFVQDSGCAWLNVAGTWQGMTLSLTAFGTPLPLITDTRSGEATGEAA